MQNACKTKTHKNNRPSQQVGLNGQASPAFHARRKVKIV